VDWLSELDPFWTSYIAFGALFTVVELIRPARKLRYRKTLLRDIVSLLVYQFGVTVAAVYVCSPAGYYVRHHLSAAVAALPLAPRVVLYYLAADFGSYWMHRLMHTRHLWRTHRWHHSPHQLYWLAGTRASVPQQILFNLPTIAALPILAGAPGWLVAAILIEGVFRNNWMHANLSWRSSWLELVFVTPRYHHIHHSADARQHDGNYGSLFSIWDRLFGTYLDPDTTQPRKFGTGEPPRDPVWLVLGV
jgi:sterol desaturase/sphingolipid hydroxylase (fatty acid hydroxylase superfamily)